MIESTNANKLICSRCRYWSDEVDDMPRGYGECRRRAPRRVNDDLMAVFPRTLSNDWCGEAGWKE